MNKKEFEKRLDIVRNQYKTSLREFDRKKNPSREDANEALMRVARKMYFLEVEDALFTADEEISDPTNLLPEIDVSTIPEEFSKFTKEVKAAFVE